MFGEIFRQTFGLNSFVAAYHIAVPIILAAIGGSLCHKTGVFNIALEGFMIIGAFVGVVGSYYLKNPYLGVFSSILAGLVFGFIFSFFALTLKADPTIIGLGINMFAIGMSTWLCSALWNTPGIFSITGTPLLPSIKTAPISAIPIINTLFSGHNLLDVVTLLLIFVSNLFLNRSVLGLQMRAVGGQKEAAISAGINATQRQYLGVIFSGIFCAIAGAYVTLSTLGFYNSNMIAGRGFLSFAAVVFSSGNILTASFISFIFGITNSFAIRLGSYGIPSQILSSIPYLFTVIILFLNAFRELSKTKLKKTHEPK